MFFFLSFWVAKEERLRVNVYLQTLFYKTSTHRMSHRAWGWGGVTLHSRYVKRDLECWVFVPSRARHCRRTLLDVWSLQRTIREVMYRRGALHQRCAGSAITRRRVKMNNMLHRWPNWEREGYCWQATQVFPMTAACACVRALRCPSFRKTWEHNNIATWVIVICLAPLFGHARILPLLALLHLSDQFMSVSFEVLWIYAILPRELV